MDNSMTNYYPGMAWPNYADYSAYAGTAGTTQYPQTQNPNPNPTGLPPMYPGTVDLAQQQAQYYNYAGANQQYNYQQQVQQAQQQQAHYQPTINYEVPPPPPPPPPPKKNQVSPLCSPTTSEPSASPEESVQQPYMSVPPMPPTFPWLTSSMYAPFSDTSVTSSSTDSSLPFVPVVLPEDRLKTMTKSIQGQVGLNTKPLNWTENIIDSQLPRALKEMFQPLYCKLCTLTLTSPVVAADHYKGKRHKKRIETWLEENQPSNKHSAISQNDPPKNQNGSYTTPIRGSCTPVSNASRPMPQKRNLSADSQNRPQFRDQTDGHRTTSSSHESLLSGANAVPLGSWSGGAPISQQPLPLMSVPVSAPFQKQANSTFSGNSSGSGSVPRFPGGSGLQSNNANKRPSTHVNRERDIAPPPKKDRKDAGGNFGYCQFCDVTLSSKVNADQHFSGKRHRENVGQARKTGNFDDMDRSFGIGTGTGFNVNSQNSTNVDL